MIVPQMIRVLCITGVSIAIASACVRAEPPASSKSVVATTAETTADTSAQSSPQQSLAPATQPATPTVFRCTLEGFPRTLVASFLPEFNLAYDTQTGKLIFAWCGDVEFTGVVYDTRHGPQPRVRGTPLLSPPDAQRHVVMLADQTDAREYRFLGHEIRDGNLVLNHEILAGDHRVLITETPTLISVAPGEVLFLRTLEVSKLPSGASIDFALGRFNPGTELSIDGTPQHAASVLHITGNQTIEIVTHLKR